jgi:transposase
LTHGGKASIFVAAMGASGYCFALATPAQTGADWLHATACALDFYGGVPRESRARDSRGNQQDQVMSRMALAAVART